MVNAGGTGIFFCVSLSDSIFDLVLLSAFGLILGGSGTRYFFSASLNDFDASFRSSFGAGGGGEVLSQAGFSA